MANRMGYNGGREYSFLEKPIWIDCNFIVDSANGNGLGIRSLKGGGVKNVFMHTSSTPGSNNGYLNPNPAVGYALVQLHSGYNKYCGGFNGLVSPVTGSNLAINATALSVGNPYIITAVGAGSSGTATIAPVADSAGSLASRWFSLYDSYGNVFIIWFSVSGVGSAPVGVSGTLVQQTISSGATAAQIGTALDLTIANLPSGVSGVNSFTASGTTTVTVVSTAARPLAGVPADSALAPTGFTFALTKSKTNDQNWHNIGLPRGVAPAVGAAFIATAQGDATLGTSSGTVKAVGVANIQNMQVVGDANQTLSPVPTGGTSNVGGWIMVQLLAATNSSTTTQIATAPTDESVIGLGFYVEAGSVLVSGE